MPLMLILRKKWDYKNHLARNEKVHLKRDELFHLTTIPKWHNRKDGLVVDYSFPHHPDRFSVNSGKPTTLYNEFIFLWMT